MTLKYTITPDEFEALPEAVQAEYKQVETGSNYALEVDLEGSPIKAALESERAKKDPKIGDPTERENALTAELDQLRSEIEERDKAEHQRTIEFALVRAIADDERVQPTAKKDMLELGRSRLEVNARGEVVTKGADDVPDGRPIKEWLDACARTRGHLFKASGRGAAGRVPEVQLQANPWRAAEWSVTAQRRIEIEDPSRAARLRRAAGQ